MASWCIYCPQLEISSTRPTPRFTRIWASHCAIISSPPLTTPTWLTTRLGEPVAQRRTSGKQASCRSWKQLERQQVAQSHPIPFIDHRGLEPASPKSNNAIATPHWLPLWLLEVKGLASDKPNPFNAQLACIVEDPSKPLWIHSNRQLWDNQSEREDSWLAACLLGGVAFWTRSKP